MWAIAGSAAAALVACSATDLEVARDKKALSAVAISLAQHGSLVQLPQEVLLRGTWGEGAGQFGKREEASRPGPMALTLDEAGRILVLDQVNRRVQRFSNEGRWLGSVPLPSEAVDDIVVLDQTIWALAWKGGRLELIQVDLDGAIVSRGRLHPSLSLPTGLFVSGHDIWLEIKHEWTYRVVSRGRLVAPEHLPDKALGRPDRYSDGARRHLAARLDPRHATVAVKDRSGALREQISLTTHAPIVQLLDLSTDARGDLFLALATGEQRDGRWSSFQRLMVVQRPGRSPAIATLGTTMATDSFRPLAVARDGTFYQLQTTQEGVRVWRYRLDEAGR